MFDTTGVGAGKDQVGPLTAPAEGELVPVLPALRPLVPGGGLRIGSVVSVEGEGSAPLGLALVAGAGLEGGWCAAVGMPEFGVRAAVGMGADPGRLLLVDEPGSRWADVVASLVEAVALVLVRLDRRPDAAVARRLVALARRHGSVLAVAGPWEGAQLRLRVEASEWVGVAEGHGHLRGRRARVSAGGRGAFGGAGRAAWLWLPGPDGAVSPAAEQTGVQRLEVVA